MSLCVWIVWVWVCVFVFVILWKILIVRCCYHAVGSLTLLCFLYKGELRSYRDGEIDRDEFKQLRWEQIEEILGEEIMRKRFIDVNNDGKVNLIRTVCTVWLCH